MKSARGWSAVVVAILVMTAAAVAPGAAVAAKAAAAPDAADGPRLEGRVIAPSGAPMAGADVELLAEATA
ncbi:MAG: hypothetical protein ABFD65_12120, partial [Candidatus Polarisedimenticolia bacterium]